MIRKGDFDMYLFWDDELTVSSSSENGLLSGLDVSEELDRLWKAEICKQE